MVVNSEYIYLYYPLLRYSSGWPSGARRSLDYCLSFMVCLDYVNISLVLSFTVFRLGVLVSPEKVVSVKMKFTVNLF